MPLLSRRYFVTGGLSVVGLGALTGCSSLTGTAPAGGSAPSTAITHVHAIAREPNGEAVLLATHQGLFRLQDRTLTQVGPTIDLMGFAFAAEGRYLASGHPSPGADLPEPLGLVESTDGGQNWKVVSRGGESDFHALTAGPAGIVGFDGQLRFSTGGRTWATRPIPSPPACLAMAPGSGAVLASTENGVLLSTDEATTWTKLDTPQLASLVAWADEHTIVATGTDGRLLTGTDTGKTWTANDRSLGEITALGANRTDDGEVEALLVVDNQIVRTVDGGASTQQLL